MDSEGSRVNGTAGDEGRESVRGYGCQDLVPGLIVKGFGNLKEVTRHGTHQLADFKSAFGTARHRGVRCTVGSRMILTSYLISFHLQLCLRITAGPKVP
eukprot:767040-Hanusia_phi.AAC.4